MPETSFETYPSRMNIGSSTAQNMPYAKSRQLHHDDAVKTYFDRLTDEGHDLSPYKYFLRSPGGIPPRAMIRFAEDMGTDIGTLLSNGIGRNNTYDCIDRAVREYYQDQHLGLVELIE